MRRLTILLTAFLAFSILLPSCSAEQKQKYQHKQRVKQLEKEKEKREQEEYEAYREARERHLKMQSKNTVRDMKRNQRKSIRHNEGKKESKIALWFKSKSRRQAKPQGDMQR